MTYIDALMEQSFGSQHMRTTRAAMIHESCPHWEFVLSVETLEEHGRNCFEKGYSCEQCWNQEYKGEKRYFKK